MTSAESQSLVARRQRFALRAVVFCLIAVVAGVVAARFVTSPAAKAAATAPPATTTLTAPVEERVLTHTVVTRGDVSAAGTVRVSVSAAYGADFTTLTARPTRVGAEVRPGAVLVEVSGRPVVVLEGKLPAYRDLHHGDVGRDVAQLQKALRALGMYSGGDAEGKVGAATEAGLKALYRSVDYTPPSSGKRVYLPRSEVTFVPTFPARLQSLDAKIGADVGDPLATVSYGGLKVVAHADPSDATLLAEGMAVRLTDQASDEHVRGTIASVGTAVTAADAASPAYLPVSIDPVGRIPASWNGADVEVEIVAAKTDGKVHVVPISAISTGADGRTTVAVVGQDGASRTVVVEVGADADGYVAITAQAGELPAGSKVVIGDR